MTNFNSIQRNSSKLVHKWALITLINVTWSSLTAAMSDREVHSTNSRLRVSRSLLTRSVPLVAAYRDVFLFQKQKARIASSEAIGCSYQLPWVVTYNLCFRSKLDAYSFIHVGTFYSCMAGRVLFMFYCWHHWFFFVFFSSSVNRLSRRFVFFCCFELLLFRVSLVFLGNFSKMVVGRPGGRFYQMDFWNVWFLNRDGILSRFFN